MEIKKINFSLTKEMQRKFSHIILLLATVMCSIIACLKGKLLNTPVLAGNDTFLTKNITQNRKRFITQPKHMIL